MRQIARSDFPMSADGRDHEGRRTGEQQTKRHSLKTSNDMLLITELLHGGEEDGAARVACFRAPQYIESMHCRGTTICLGCGGGAVCILQAPFLAL